MIWLPQIFEAMTGGGHLIGAAVRRTTERTTSFVNCPETA
jgi:c-di-AMP phosphodiesterase-like protein